MLPSIETTPLSFRIILGTKNASCGRQDLLLGTYRTFRDAMATYTLYSQQMSEGSYYDTILLEHYVNDGAYKNYSPILISSLELGEYTP